MGKITVDCVDPKNEIDAESSRITVPQDSKLARFVSKKIEAIKSDVYSCRFEIGRTGEELVKDRVKSEKLEAKSVLIHKELGDIKTKVDKELAEIRKDNLSIRRELEKVRQGEKATQVAAAIGAVAMTKAIINKVIPWRKS